MPHDFGFYRTPCMAKWGMILQWAAPDQLQVPSQFWKVLVPVSEVFHRVQVQILKCILTLSHAMNGKSAVRSRCLIHPSKFFSKCLVIIGMLETQN